MNCHLSIMTVFVPQWDVALVRRAAGDEGSKTT